MKTRLFLALVAAAAAGRALAQQPQVDATVHYALNWSNSATGGQDPIGRGQSAILRLTLTLDPPPGSIVAVNNVPGTAATQLTLRAFQQMFIDLVGVNDASGAWSGLLVDETWDLFGPSSYGTPVAGGANLLDIRAGQWPSWQLVITLNPIVDIWTGMWTPSSYAPRTVSFAPANGSANPEPFASRVMLRQGSTIPVLVGTVHDGFNPAHIPVIPAPGGLALLGLAGLGAVRRRGLVGGRPQEFSPRRRRLRAYRQLPVC